ncbi:hypothetical protein MMC26_004999 [Xylographa opegraphella]|nr:hypothetical protein [Xylographa opegraphella]
MPILDYIESSLSHHLSNQKGRHAKLFTNGPAFAAFPAPTFTVDSLDCGPSGSRMRPEYTQVGEDRFPALTWSALEAAAEAAAEDEVKQYLVVVEDPDAPLPTPATHAVFYAIPPDTCGIAAGDIEPVVGSERERKLRGGFRYGKNVRGTIYGGPRPLLNHGPHDYYYQVVALKEPLDTTGMSAAPTKSELAVGIVGKVAGWGAWVGTFERKWK